MLKAIHEWIIDTHIVLGVFATLAFWAQIFSKKGGWLHVRSGVVFVFSCTVVLLSAVVAVTMTSIIPTILVPPEAVEAMRPMIVVAGVMFAWGSLVTWLCLWQGLTALRLKRARGEIAPRPLLKGSNWFAIIVAGPLMVALYYMKRLELWLIVIVLLPVMWSNLRALRTIPRPKGFWYLEHMRGTLLAGSVMQGVFFLVALDPPVEAAFGRTVARASWPIPFLAGFLMTWIWYRSVARKMKDPEAVAAPVLAESR